MGIKFYGLSCGKLDRRWLPNTLYGIPQTIKSLFDAINIISQEKVDLVVSFGGYLSVPVIIAAWLKKIPSLTHEQTLTLSLSTKINSLFCQKVALSFPSPHLSAKYVVTGNLLRRDIFLSSSAKFQKLEKDLKKFPLIFLTAGNQGSTHLNQTLKQILPNLTQKFTIIHQCGALDFPEYQALQKKFLHYYPQAYIDSQDIGWLFHHSSLIISRAGANTIQEIAALKLKSIVIPLPVSQQNEQLKNALWLKKQLPETTIIIKDRQLSGKKLLSTITKIISLPTHLSSVNKASPNLKLLNLIKRL